MKRRTTPLSVLLLVLLTFGCSRQKSDPRAEAPPPLRVEKIEDRNVFEVDHPDRFPLVKAAEYLAAPQLLVTGTVTPDILRAVPVISLATGRVVEIDARLGDTVKKGQLLLKLQSADISSAYSDYQKASADEQLARTQLERAKLLYDKGAISQNDLQIAQNAEDKAKIDVANTAERLRVLGSNPRSPQRPDRNPRPHLGLHYRSASHQRGRRRRAWFAQPLYDCRPDLRMDSLRRVRERPGQCASRRKGRHSPERLSWAGILRDHRQHRPHPGPRHPHSESSHRNAQPRPHAPGDVRLRHVPLTREAEPGVCARHSHPSSP